MQSVHFHEGGHMAPRSHHFQRWWLLQAHEIKTAFSLPEQHTGQLCDGDNHNDDADDDSNGGGTPVSVLPLRPRW